MRISVHLCDRVVDVSVRLLWDVKQVGVPWRQRDVLHEAQRQIGLDAQSCSLASCKKDRERKRTLLIYALPNAMSCPVSSATFIADSRVKPPAATSGRGSQILRTNSFD